MAKAELLEPNQCDLAKVPRHHGIIGRAWCSGTDGVIVSESLHHGRATMSSQPESWEPKYRPGLMFNYGII